MRFLNHNIELAIFDLDGTLIESTGIWAEVDTKFFHKRHMELPKTYAQDIAHVGLKEAARITKVKYLPNENEENIIQEWFGYTKQAYDEEIMLKPHAKEVLDFFKNNGVHIALATVNHRDLYLKCLQRLGIFDYFEFMIDVDGAPDGKSTTEIYDIVKDHFNVDKSEVIIFEDALSPIRVASEKYLVIGVYDEHSCKDKIAHKNACHYQVDDLSEILKLKEKN